MTENAWVSLFESLKIIGPAVILPIVILILTNRNSRKIKLLEQKHDINRIKEAKVVDDTFIEKNEKQKHEKLVHSTLIKILFEIQRLHINLSGTCVDFKCIEDCTKDFKDNFTKYQNVIAENQIYLSSKVTNILYKFYKRLGSLLVELKDIQNSKNFDLAIIAVYDSSTELAEYVIQIQEAFIQKRLDLQNEFSSNDLKDFKSCCGQQPPLQVLERYHQLRQQLQNLPEPIDEVDLKES